MAGERETSPQNKQVLKRLLADPDNKTCADCKTATHPRWASWNLGIFLCIRCSGVHRSLGTHISKVRSVDLDSWTDMHLEQMIRWGNRRANLYWEAKLGPHYVPDSSKIVNFIKTKYDLKRWVSSSTVPDPKALDSGKAASEDIPLSQVKQKLAPTPARAAPSHSIDLLGGYSASQPSLRTAPAAKPAVSLLDLDDPTPTRPPAPQPGPQPVPAARPVKPLASARTGPVLTQPRASPAPAPAPQVAPAPSSAPPTPAPTQRADLKKSILSLYAQKPQPAARPAAPAAPTASTAPTAQFTTPAPKPASDSLADLDFGAWTTTPSAPAPMPSTARPAAPSGPALSDSLAGLSFQPMQASAPAPAAAPSAPTPTSTHSPFTAAPEPEPMPEMESGDVFANVWK